MQLRVTHSAVGTARSCAVKVAHTLRPSVAAKVSKGTQAAEAASQAVKDVEVEADQHGLPGQTELMKVKPLIIKPDYKGSGKLSGKVALITGGDSGIGRSIAVHFAKEGAKGVVIVHLAEEQQDAEETVRLVEAEGCKCHAVVADVTEPKAGELAVNAAIKQFGQLDVLINNAGEQTKKESILDITPEQLQRTFATNIFSMFYLTKAALPHLKPGSSIINAASLLAYQAKPVLVDYASSKGAVVSFTRSLSEQLVGKGIRVNAVAPGPTWTPLNPATMGEDLAKTFGEEVPMKRGGQPCEIATAYVFLASEVDSSFITGQVLHPNGGAVLNV